MEHVTISYDPGAFAAWPFSHGLWAFPDGEVVAGFTRGPCAYEQSYDVQHWVVDPLSEQVTMRSPDLGRTWPADSLAVTATHQGVERAWLDGTMPPATPDPPDWTAPDFCMTAGFSVPPRRFQHAGYIQYSRDRGRSYNLRPVPSLGFGHVQVKPHHVVRPDGVVLLFVTVARVDPNDEYLYGTFGHRFVAVYASSDRGVTWSYLSALLAESPDSRFIERYYASPAVLRTGGSSPPSAANSTASTPGPSCTPRTTAAGVGGSSRGSPTGAARPTSPACATAVSSPSTAGARRRSASAPASRRTAGARGSRSSSCATTAARPTSVTRGRPSCRTAT